MTLRNLIYCASILAMTGAGQHLLAAAGVFDLNVSTFGFNKQQRDAFATAEAFWENVIVGYAPGITQTTVSFTARKLGIDGPGGILGQAGPSGTVTQGGYVLSTGGSMIIDATDIDLLAGDGKLSDVIAHEIGHILGIGTLWTSNGVYVNGTGRYTGAFGLAAYREEFDPNAIYVPVELDGGPGTANGHWDELTTVTDPLGRPLSEELMSGYLGTENYLSQTTLQSLKDLGFVVVEAPVPILAGDYNEDGIVNLADYTVWRDHEGSSAGTLPNDPDDDAIGPGQYNTWKGNYGATAAAGATTGLQVSAIPEPSAVILCVLAFICHHQCCRAALAVAGRASP